MRNEKYSESDYKLNWNKITHLDTRACEGVDWERKKEREKCQLITSANGWWLFSFRSFAAYLSKIYVQMVELKVLKSVTYFFFSDKFKEKSEQFFRKSNNQKSINKTFIKILHAAVIWETSIKWLKASKSLHVKFLIYLCAGQSMSNGQKKGSIA